MLNIRNKYPNISFRVSLLHILSASVRHNKTYLHGISPQHLPRLSLFPVTFNRCAWVYHIRTDWERERERSLCHQKVNLHENYYLIRMHLMGDPSAPTNLRGKQCTEYIPGWTSSSFRPSTSMTSWNIWAILASCVDPSNFTWIHALLHKLSFYLSCKRSQRHIMVFQLQSGTPID